MVKPIQGTQTFSRGMALLQMIAERASPPTVQELLAECDLTRPTLYRLLAGLEAEQLVYQTGSKRYKLGMRLVTLARRALADTDVRHLARAELETLREVTGETVHLAIRSGDEMVYIDKIESHEVVRMTSTVGTRVPFHSSAAGKAFLAAMVPDKAELLLQSLPLQKITEFTTTNLDDLKNQIHVARQQGYIFDNQENEVGIVCYGAAILDETGKPVASVSVSVPLFRHQEPTKYIAPLMLQIDKVSRIMGYVR